MIRGWGEGGNRDPKSSFHFSPYSAFSNNPVLYSDILGDTTGVYTDKGKYLGITIPDNLPNAIITIPAGMEKGFMDRVTAWKSKHPNPTQEDYNEAGKLARAVMGTRAYAIDEYVGFYEKYKNAYPARWVNHQAVDPNVTYYLMNDRGTRPLKLYSEVTMNLIVKGNTLHLGNFGSTDWNFNSSHPSSNRHEPSTAASIHLHPLAEEGTIGYKYGQTMINVGSPATPGRPSSPDDYQNAGKSGWRDVIVDEKNIMLHNSNASENIILNRSNKWGPPRK